MQSTDDGSGLERALTPADVVAAVEAQVSYLRIALDPSPADGWIATTDLLADPALLTESIRTTGAGRSAPDDQVAASLWFQAYAFRAALPVLAPFALGLDGLSGRPDDTSIRIARNRPAAVGLPTGPVVARTAADVATDLLGGHLEPVVEAITASIRVGHRLLWGNAAASFATVLRALDGAPEADQAAVRSRGTAVGDQAGRWFDGLGKFDTVEEAGRTGWYWTRTNCCLWDRCEGASRCDDCSLTSAADLDLARRQDLRRAAEEATS